MKTNVIILLIAFALFYLMHKENQAREQMFKNTIKEYEDRRVEMMRVIDSLEREYDYLAVHYRNLSKAYRDSYADAIKYKNLYEKQRKKKISISRDADYDSILNMLYPR